MTLHAGCSYRGEISVKVSLLPVKAEIIICLDTLESFHGSVTALGKTVRFSDGRKVGEDYRFTGTAMGITADITCRLHDDGTITGTALAEGSQFKLTGQVLSEEKGILV